MNVRELLEILSTANPDGYVSFSPDGVYGFDSVSVDKLGTVDSTVGGAEWADYED